MIKSFSLLVLLLYYFTFNLKAQDDLLKILEDSLPGQQQELVTGTFKSTRIINGHSVELREAGVLDFLISHRFGRLNSGAYHFFGLDEANIRLGLEYGLTSRLNIGIGRSSFQKTFDGFLKYRILSQKSDNSIPISLVAYTSMAINSLRMPDETIDPPFSSRLYYTWQLLLGRKFNSNFSMQITPTIIHRNMVSRSFENNDLYAVGIGGRHKISPRVSVNGEYFYQINQNVEILNYNSISLGVDIETGGHVFQLHITNSRAMIEKGFIAETTGDFWNGDIHFGFNISRVFQLKAGNRITDSLLD